MVSRKWAYRELFNSEEAAGDFTSLLPQISTLPSLSRSAAVCMLHSLLQGCSLAEARRSD